VLILAKQQIRVSIAFILTRRKKANRSVSAPKAVLSELMFGKDVKLRPHTIDRYGCLVARVPVDGS
jgi:hypothetical protein